MAIIGILAIIVVLGILSILCTAVAVFAYVSIPGTPTVTISPIDFPFNYTGIGSSADVVAGHVSTILMSLL